MDAVITETTGMTSSAAHHDWVARHRNFTGTSAEASFVSTGSFYGMPLYHPQRSDTIRTCTTIGDLPEKLGALDVNESGPQDLQMEDDISRPPGKLQAAAVGAPAVGSTLLPSTAGMQERASDVPSAPQLSNVSRPPGTLNCAVVAAPAVVNVLIPVPVIAVATPYQWCESASAYSMPSALRDHKGRERSRCRHRRARDDGQQIPREDETAEDSEEVWKNREKERRIPVKNLKDSAVYIDNQDYGPRPTTPDPSCRLHKRPWEKLVAQWRSEWRAIDGVRKLVKQGFEENASRVAWQEAKAKLNLQLAHDQEAQLKEAVKLLKA